MSDDEVFRNRRALLAEGPMPKNATEVLAQLVLGVIKFPIGIETIDFEIARTILMTDQERADKYKKVFQERALPICALLKEMVDAGFAVQFTIGLNEDKSPNTKFEVSKLVKL